MSSSKSSNTEEAVLITGPTLTEDAAGLTVVQSEHCQNVRTSSVMKRLADRITGVKQAEEKELVEIKDMGRSKDSLECKQSYPNQEYQDEDENCHETQLSGHYFNETDASGDIDQNEKHINNAVPTFLLGVRYHTVEDFDARKEDEAHLFWFTYRCDFPAIQPYGITSDAGWGCMLRATQMMMAQALRMHYNGRDWKPRYLRDPFVQSIFTWFADFPSTNKCFYSIHNMVATGMAKYDKLPGEWFGPSTASFVLRDLVALHAQKNDSLFRVHVVSGSTVFRDDLALAASAEKNTRPTPTVQKQPSHPLENVWEEELLGRRPWDHSMLVLIPLRLGLRSFHKDYVDLLAHTFSFPQSVGVLGGRPRGARWFYGSVGRKVLGLDPHTVQAAPTLKSQRVDTSDIAYQSSLFAKYPEVCAMASLDPSIALGFYCKTEKDFEDIVERLQSYGKEHPGIPELFTVQDRAPDYTSTPTFLEDDEGVFTEGFEDSEADDFCDDFVVL